MKDLTNKGGFWPRPNPDGSLIGQIEYAGAHWDDRGRTIHPTDGVGTKSPECPIPDVGEVVLWSGKKYRVVSLGVCPWQRLWAGTHGPDLELMIRPV